MSTSGWLALAAGLQGHREGEQAIIERLRALRTAELGFDKISDQLNAEGMKPHSGERWWGRSVNNTLKLAKG